MEDERPTQVAVLDCRGLLCPLPLLKTQQAVADLQDGQVLEVWTTDPQSEGDLRAWAQAAGHQVTPLPPQDGVYRFHLRKGPSGR
ncbi:MAG: sulfurtransferase TusA family protein [Armatimonadota bacterium]|nr:sulfurtransferase TusA family protein [Armatimonadota bacterium]MDW8156849.1 sulfurtransferase TusA family protein [Armatimonadota bacterium]